MDRAPTIEVSELRKTYGDVVALDGVTFSVEPGEVVGFLGPNGAGKTTTMKILTGFISATEGSARVAGLDVCADSLEVRRRIGYLPENAPVYRDMAVRDYLRFVCDVRGLSKAERERRIRATSGQVGLDSVLDRPIQELSKGFRQRVGLAQALVHDPEILILDEPTTGLDPNQIADIRDLIIEIGRTRTVLLSTHILQEVKAVCGRVLIVSKGRIVGFGTPAELEASAAGGRRIDVVLRAARGSAGAWGGAGPRPPAPARSLRSRTSPRCGTGRARGPAPSASPSPPTGRAIPGTRSSPSPWSAAGPCCT